MIVLSLFDGISAGHVAFDRSNIQVKKYYASEIDKYAQIISEKNYPDIIRIGDIRNWRDWNIEQPDIIIGGSPCQGFSFAGKRLNLEDPRSRLFFVFRDIVRHYNPKYFLLENVRMDKESENIISREMGIQPTLINSALVSAQNRQRLYWTNINHKKDLFGDMLPGIEQPKDRKIYLKDIIETPGTRILNNNGNWKNKNDKSNCIDANYYKGVDNHAQRTMIKSGRIVGRNPENPKSRKSGLPTKQQLEIRKDGKTNCLTSVQKDNVVCHTKNYIQYDSSGKGHNSQDMRLFFKEKKSNNLNVSHSSIPKLIENETDNEYQWRKLTPIECERLQTIDDDFTNHVSNSQRYKALGNSWTVDVISHILNHISKPEVGK